MKLTSALRSRWHRENAWAETRYEEYERDIFNSFFTIRRLAECNKLSEGLVARRIRVQTFRPTGERVTLMSRYDLPELYDLEHPLRSMLNLLFLCNQVIHSYVFMLFIDGGRRTSSFFFSSARERRRAAYRMTRGAFAALLRTVGRNYPRMAEFEFDDQKDDYRVRMI